MSRPVVEIDGVILRARAASASAVEIRSWSLESGGLAWVWISETAAGRLLADAVGGLLEPEQGSILFRGDDWRTLSPARSAAARGRIGRVFDPPGWVSNLDVDENILLAGRFHRRGPDAALRVEAEALAGQCGLSGLPQARPSKVSRSDLRSAEWVRALVGEPDLLLLENPERGAQSDRVRALREAVQSARRRGAAVVWIRSESAGGVPAELEPTGVFRLSGGVFQAEA